MRRWMCAVWLLCAMNGPAQVDIGQIANKAARKYSPLEPLLTSGSAVIRTPEDWNRKRATIDATLRSYLGDPPTTTVELRPRVLREEKLDGYMRRKVRYLVAPSEDAVAYLLAPDAAQTTDTRLPAVLAMHQTAEAGKEEVVGLQGRPSMHYGMDLVNRGYVVLAPDSITAGERIYNGYEPFVTEAFDKAHPEWSAIGKMVWDHQRGIDYLESLPFVDAERIGAIGHSLGAYNAFFLAALDQRVRAVVESCGYTTIASDEARERWARTSWFIHIPKLRPFVEPGSKLNPPFDFHEVLSLLAPRPLFQSVGLRDTIFPSCDSAAQVQEELEPLYRLLGARGAVQMFIFDGEHDFPDEARERAYQFLDSHLKR